MARKRVTRRLHALGLVVSGALAASCGLSTLGLGTTEGLDSRDAGADESAPDLDTGAGETSNAEDASVDGPPDADATSADAAGDAKDTAPPDADAGADSGLGCAVGATATLLCDDFDNGATGWASFWTAVNPNGLLASDLTTYVSAPRSVSASVLVATPDGYQVGLYKQITFGTTVTVDLDYEATATNGYLEILQVMFGGTDNARLLVSTSDTIAYLDGYSGTPRLGVAKGASTLGAWHHAHVVFVLATSGGKVSMAIDGAAAITSATGNTLGTAPAKLDVHVGSSPGTGQGASKVNIDNFVLSVIP
ncbi:MAG: hypothetical protein ABIP39_08620 [Polyangiaceae bacterium]